MTHAPRASFSVVNILAGSQWMLLRSHCASHGDMPPIKAAVNRILLVKVLLFSQTTHVCSCIFFL